MTSRWRKLQGRSAAEERAMYLEWQVLPAVRHVLRQHPEAPGVLVCVAQYWNDNANDEVHVDGLLLEPGMDPQAWPPRPPQRYLDEAREQACGWLDELPPEVRADLEFEPDPAEIAASALQDWWWEQRSQFRSAQSAAHLGSGLGYMEPAAGLAAFCVGQANQHQSRGESFRPMWWITPGITPGQLIVTLVGTVHQPAWEERYELGIRPGVQAESAVRPDPPLAGISMATLADLYVHEPDVVNYAMDEILAIARAKIEGTARPAARADRFVWGFDRCLGRPAW